MFIFITLTLCLGTYLESILYAIFLSLYIHSDLLTVSSPKSLLFYQLC